MRKLSSITDFTFFFRGPLSLYHTRQFNKSLHNPLQIQFLLPELLHVNRIDVQWNCYVCEQQHCWHCFLFRYVCFSNWQGKPTSNILKQLQFLVTYTLTYGPLPVPSSCSCAAGLFNYGKHLWWDEILTFM